MIHTPEDMTVSVNADVALADLQSALARSRQWLPLDPPRSDARLREILDHNESGPRRYGYGTPRDYVIGLKVKLADGRIVKSGGQVVKNVAGYDLQKLFIGSGGALGKILDVTFKLRPIPELEKFVRQEFDSPNKAATAVEAVMSSTLTPVVFDLYRQTTDVSSATTLVLGFDGAKEDVDWQLALAATLGFQTASNLDYDKSFRAAKPARKNSVLPSKLIEALHDLGGESFVARAGNGIIYHRGHREAPRPNLPTHLFRRMKDAFDPQHILPGLSA